MTATEDEVPPYLLGLYNVRGKIGEGAYGVVYLAITRDKQRKLLAIKTFKPGEEDDGISVTAIREIMLLRELKHANIVKLEAVHVNRKESSLSLAFGFADTDLYEMVKYHREKERRGAFEFAGFHPYTLKSLMWQLLKGSNAMHENWMLHRDLKPANILVVGQGPESGTLKIADFGLARAPELLLGALHYTPAVDIWAVGCIFAELIILKPLFQGEERKKPANVFQASQMDKIAALLGPPNLKEWPELACLQHWRENTEDICVKLSRNPVGPSHLLHYIQGCAKTKDITADGSAVDLLRRLLTYNPNQRITASEALEHPYFKQAPLPGNNAFVHHSTRVAAYPSRLPDRLYRDIQPPVAQDQPFGKNSSRGVSPHPQSRPGLKDSDLPKRRRTDFGPGFR